VESQGELSGRIIQGGWGRLGLPSIRWTRLTFPPFRAEWGCQRTEGSCAINHQPHHEGKPPAAGELIGEVVKTGRVSPFHRTHHKSVLVRPWQDEESSLAAEILHKAFGGRGLKFLTPERGGVRGKRNLGTIHHVFQAVVI